MSKIKIIFSVLIILLSISCVTNPPHRTEYYTEFLTDKYSGSDFEYIDKIIVNLDKENEESIETLITLINKVAKTDWEKTRAIYIWITHNIAYDTKAYFGGLDGPADALGTFESRHSVCNGYAELFVEIAEGVGLEASKVVGYGKGVSYQEGIVPEGTNHAWNSVKLDGKWHLFDATWGAGSLRRKRYVWGYDEFYFDTEPDELIFSHYPEEPAFQLLAQPISRSTFFRLPNFRSQFFKGKFNTNDIFDRAINGETLTSPVFYTCKYPYTLLQLPITSTLNSSKKYKIIIESKSSLLIIKNGPGDPKLIRNTDGKFFIDQVFRKGELILFMSDPQNDKTYSGLLKYFVE